MFFFFKLKVKFEKMIIKKIMIDVYIDVNLLFCNNF